MANMNPSKRRSASTAAPPVLCVVLLLLVVVLLSSCGWLSEAFMNNKSPSRRHGNIGSGIGGRGGNGNNGHNWLFPSGGGGNDGGGDSSSFVPATIQFINEDEMIDEEDDDMMQEARSKAPSVRGGSSRFRKKQSPPNKNTQTDDLVKGSQVTMAKTASFWKTQLDKITNTITSIIPKRNKKLSKNELKQKELLQQLQTMPIQKVRVAPNTTVLPPDVIRIAVRRSGLIGNPLRTDRVQEIANTLKQWYLRKGYVLHSVTGATLHPESATAELQVQEPQMSNVPVSIVVCKEMVIDQESGKYMTFKEYKKYHTTKQTVGYDKIDKSNVNTTYILANKPSRTRPNRIASALQLKPGTSFRWSELRWNNIVSSGIFGRVLRASPNPMNDGTVQLQLLVTEPPPRHLEYGIGKSLYTGGWEGELDFEHSNVLGGGENIGVSVKRGTNDESPSIRLKFEDNKFGMAGGYDVEVFSDYLGSSTDSVVDDDGNVKKKPPKADASGGSSGSRFSLNGLRNHVPSMSGMNLWGRNKKSSKTVNDPPSSQASAPSSSDGAGDVTSGSSTANDDNDDSLFLRRGGTIRLKNPIPTNTMRNSVASASLERTSTRNGLEESIASGTITLGPFRKELPNDARTQFVTTITTGGRISDSDQIFLDGDPKRDAFRGGFQGSDTGRWNVLPFASISATTKQILPLSTPPSSSSSNAMIPSSLSLTPEQQQQLALQQQQQQRPYRPPITLALSHTVATSTKYLPRHESNAMAIASQIRGASPPGGRASSSVRGTTELRVPVVRGASAVLFGDWFYVQKDSSSPFKFQSSIGVGLRKNFQGLPLKYDICYSSHNGKIKAMFGLGPDFDA